MSDIVVSAKDISKKYQIGRQVNPKFHTFRDAMVMNASKLKNKLRHPRTSESLFSSSSEDFWALRDVSFELNEGDRLGVIGRNGAGKSTLLKILSRITLPTTGTVSLRGRIASLLEVGTGFHPELTGRENIYLNGAVLGMKRAEIKRSFDEIVNFAGIEKFLETPVKRYSSGMYVRLAFAVGAHLQPDILIVDEVLAVGDAEFQKKCLGKMESVSREGRTIIFVSHNLGSVLNLCNKGLLLDNGRSVYSGEAKTAVNQYLNISGPTQTGRFERPDFAEGLQTIRTVELLDENLKHQFLFEYAQKMFVRIATNPMMNQEFGIEFRLKNSKHEYLGYGSSWVANAKTGGGTFQPGETVLIEIPRLNLAEDTYYLDLFCRTPRNVLAVDYWFDTVNFTVSNTRPEGSPFAIYLDANFGSIIFDEVKMGVSSLGSA